MKRSLALLLTLVMSLGLLAGCGSKDTTADESQQDGESGAKQIETLKVAFVPSREPQEIITATEPLKQLLKDELAKEGYEVGEVEITVGTTYEAVGEGLEAGTIDVGLIPGGTYVLYDDGAEVILTATRDGLNKDSDNAKDWNDGQPTEASDKQAVSYRALIIAGPSDKGQELAAKVNNGEELTWEDLDSANWSIMGTSSPAGYIYPALWLQDHYGKGISDLSSAVQSDSYASAFARLASGQVDVLVTYADAASELPQRLAGKGAHVRSVHRQRAGGDPVHAVHRAQQRRFSRAGAADDGDELAVLNGQVHIVKSHRAVGIYLGYMVKYDHTVSSFS